MSDIYLYVSLMPEALIASMLPPEQFASYLTVGTKKSDLGDALFFQLTTDWASNHFDLSSLQERCHPHDDGEPKHTLYLGIYRVLENIPTEAFQDLFLVTRDGRSLRLKAAETLPAFDGKRFLYDEISPVRSFLASSLNPSEFTEFITNKDFPLYVPRIFFAQRSIRTFEEAMAAMQENMPPFRFLPERVQDCLAEVQSGKKKTKTIIRISEVRAWMNIENGFYLGAADKLLYFPFPSSKELSENHHDWLKSAKT